MKALSYDVFHKRSAISKINSASSVEQDRSDDSVKTAETLYHQHHKGLLAASL